MSKRTISTRQMEEACEVLGNFMGENQEKAMINGFFGEEGDFFSEKFLEFKKRIEEMPKTYEQNGKGKKATVFLHYFLGGCDWYIIEKDCGFEQIQAFGFADLGYGPEFGYIDLNEILEAGAELDLHFEPKTADEILKKIDEAPCVEAVIL